MENPKCKKCNRPLKSEESIKLGYGKICYKKLFGKDLKTSKIKNKIRGKDLFDTNIYK